MEMELRLGHRFERRAEVRIGHRRMLRCRRPVTSHAPVDRAARLRTLLGSIAWWAAWLVAVELIALGAAGLAAGVDHEPGTAARAELTYAGDSAIRPGLDAATADAEKLSDDLDR